MSHKQSRQNLFTVLARVLEPFVRFWTSLWCLNIQWDMTEAKAKKLMILIEGSLEVKLPTKMDRWKSRGGKSQRREEKRREEKRRLAELLRFGAVKFKTWGSLAEEVSQNWFVFKLADRQTGRQAGRQTDRQKDRRTDRQTDRQAGRQAGRQADRQTDRQRQIDREMDGWMDGWTDGQMDWQMGRWTDGQMDR